MNQVFALLLALSPLQDAGAPAGADEKELVELLMPYYGVEAREYAFFLDEGRRQPLKIDEQPLLKWVATTPYMGAVYVWTDDGRPQVIGCIGSEQRDGEVHRVFHEFHALGDQPLPGVELAGTGKTWRPESAGIEMRVAQGMAPPDADERKRAFQMRSVARPFEAMTVEQNGGEVLRLLPKPLYRYSSPRQGVIDGAIFSYVRGSGFDPEVLLIVEARESEDGPVWMFAPARFNWCELKASYNGEEIWHAEETSEFWNSTELKQSYFSGVMHDVSRDDIRKRVAGANSK